MMCENRKTASEWLCLLLIRIYFLCYRAEEIKTALVPFPGKQEFVTTVDLFWGSCGVGNVERSLCTSINPIGQGRQDGGAVARKRDKKLGHRKNGEACLGASRVVLFVGMTRCQGGVREERGT